MNTANTGGTDEARDKLAENSREELHRQLQELAGDGTIGCPVALALARRLGVNPLQVGGAADELGIRITDCQLGCFGAGKRDREGGD